MRRVNVLVSVGLTLLLVVGNASLAAAQQQQQVISTSLVSENASGVTGSAMVTDLGSGKIRVEIHAIGAGSEPRPAHIHEGQCLNEPASMNMGMGQDPARPEYVLTTVVNGVSSTDLALTMTDLLAMPHAIEVHKSADEIGFYIACADVLALPTSYTVAAGDSLSDIALRLYGDGDRWPAIFDANRSLISNPNHIVSGQVLTIKP